jgi:hypothetical protein
MFRFTLREAALVVAIIAIAIAWRVDRSKLLHETELQEAEAYSWRYRAEAAKKEMQKHGWAVTWGDDSAAFENDEMHYISSHHWGIN